MILLEGKSLSKEILLDLKTKIENLPSRINLDIILVGNDPSSVTYVDIKQKKAELVGINCRIHRLPEDTSYEKLQKEALDLNQNPECDGYFFQLPIPSLSNPSALLKQIKIDKDVDGLNPESGVYPAVVRAIVNLLENYQISFDQKNIVIVNDSDLIGKPLKKYLSQFTSDITLLNRQSLDLTPHTLQADILISATGVKNLITANMVKEGAIVVDVANGDVDFENVSKKCSHITPTFGGVGPMTVASLLETTFRLSQRK